MLRVLIPVLLVAGVLAGIGLAQHKTSNEAFLGIVAVPGGKAGTVVIAHVLPKSPAAAAKLKVGEQLLSIESTKVGKPEDVDKALAEHEPGKQVRLVVIRDGKKEKVVPRLIARKDYKGDDLKRQARGKTGFKAPAWHIYAWANVEKDAEPPTREDTKG